MLNFNTFYHEFIIVYRCRYPRYWMGIGRIYVLCRRIDTCIISYCYCRCNFRPPQKTNDYIK